MDNAYLISLSRRDSVALARNERRSPPPYIKVGGGGTPLRYWVLGTGDWKKFFKIWWWVMSNHHNFKGFTPRPQSLIPSKESLLPEV
ncbi:MAG: hypothetical protein V7K25_02255 [Nostoc sp.]|uniref:hypothetical protein n=1 Tax=Nostoc sp. TaxID=1180 RepID=UPI002FF82061